MRPNRMALTALTVLVIASGCAAAGDPDAGGPSTPAAPASQARSASPARDGGASGTYQCAELISAAELATATGAAGLSLQPPSGQALPGATYCVFATPGNEIRVNVNIWTGVGFAEMYPRLENTANLQDAPHLSGVGDDARWVAALGMLIARTGDKGVQISTPLGADKIGDTRASSVAIATLVLPRL